MKRKFNFSFVGMLVIIAGTIIVSANASVIPDKWHSEYQLIGKKTTRGRDTTVQDTSKLKYPFKDKEGSPFTTPANSPLYMKNPSNIETSVEFNDKTKDYEYTEKAGDIKYRQPTPLTLDEYRNYDFDNSLKSYWNERIKNDRMTRQGSDPFSKFLNPKLNIPIVGFDKIFGTNTIDIKPRGSAELIFGFSISKVENPSLPKNLQNHYSFDFDEKIQMGVTGAIGDKMKVGINYNTEATFDFENETKLGYTGKEDEIIQNIEAGNITFPLNGTLISGSHSLFGLKTELKFGKLYATTVFSQQKGQSQSLQLKGGAQSQDFEIYADDYEANKHFFLGHYFEHGYEKWLEMLPIIQSGIKITKIEVWITNKQGDVQNTRNIIGFMDLAESQKNIFAPQLFRQMTGDSVPQNETNDLYAKMRALGDDIRKTEKIATILNTSFADFQSGKDWDRIDNARKLDENKEYTINYDLGYISLNQALNSDEVLAVAFEYTYNGVTKRVGEFSNELEPPKTLILKLIKGTNLTPKLPTWGLMMKNVYSMGAYQVNKENFMMQIMYKNDQTGAAVNYINEGNIKKKPLLQVMNLDRLNSQNDPHPDGFFDFIQGITINSSNGRIIFPVLQPFGNYLARKIGDKQIADRYTFSELYDSTQTKAKQLAEKNKFFLSGTYQSSSGSEINLGAMNVPQGSVKVTAGGTPMKEGEDYMVDYMLGRVTILNQSVLQSGTPINVSLENNAMFSMQTKTLIGTNLNYKFNDDFQLGGTILHLSEKPLTNKVTMGDEPISNTIWGLDGSYTKEAPWLTKAIDKLPFIATKAPSSITINAEFAHLIPGHSKAVKKEGVSYIDDFEGAKTNYDLKTFNSWSLATTPQGQLDLFPEGDRSNDLAYGYNRAKIAWYSIITDLQRSTTVTPGHLTKDDQSNHFVREVFERDLFPEKESPTGLPTTLQVLNLAFYPTEKGQYNYDAAGEPGISAGITTKGELKQPTSRWGGIMRQITPSDFESGNIEFIEFWMMDPFVYDPTHSGGELYFNLGNISEDILRDSRQTFENGLPITADSSKTAVTTWGIVPVIPPVSRAFDNNNQDTQDVGLDGLSNEKEQSFFQTYLNAIKKLFGDGSDAYKKAVEDPSSDNYHYFRGGDYDQQKLSILDRYKKYNGTEGNSPTIGKSPESYATSGTTQPDKEDINDNNTLDEVESYFQYQIKLTPSALQVGQNYITDVIEDTQSRKNGKTSTVKWYQFKIPIYQPDKTVGPIQDFKSIRFMRMFLKGFSKEVVLRFAKLDLVRGEWRKYNFDISEGSEMTSIPQKVEGVFEISAVNIEENGTKKPVNYILPPGVDRVIDPNNPQLRQLNEQALLLKVLNLEDGDARGAYKTMNIDVRQYKRLKMYIHAEQIKDQILKDNDLTVFVRLGSDFRENYYEYEIPVKVTPPGNYDKESNEERLIVWPEENNLDLEFSKLQDAKQRRNDEMRRFGSSVNMSTPYVIQEGNNRIKVKGNPNLSNVRIIMIGIRNPRQQSNKISDDGFQKTGEIWVNELRLADFDESGGWAANTRIVGRLADLGDVTFFGTTSKPGFGSLEKKVAERQKEEIYDYSLSSNLEFGKFFPQRFGVRLPVRLEYAEKFINPQYNPIDPDIELKDALSRAGSKHEKDSIKNIAQDYVRRKSLNFTNIRIENPLGKEDKDRTTPKFYSLANWSLGYAYTETFASNIKTEYDRQTQQTGVLSYNFATTPKPIEPFKGLKIFSSPGLAIIRDFNFFYMPQSFSFRTDMNRNYQEMQLRDINHIRDPKLPEIILEPSFRKDFLWNRVYDLKYDLTRNLKIDFSAQNTARIDEPDGRIAKQEDDYKQKIDTIWTRILDGGRTTQYHQIFNATYNVPINKIPLFGWITVNTRYTGTFDWDAGPQMADKTIDLGNSIKNSNNIQVNAQFNLQSIYNQVGFLKQIDQEMQQRKSGNNPNQKTTTVTYEKKGLNLIANRPKTITHKLGTKEVEMVVTDLNGDPISGETKVINTSKVIFTADKNYKNVTVKITGKKIINENILVTIGKYSINTLMLVRNVSFSYSEANGTVLPGYSPTTQFFGLRSQNGILAPGVPFIIGWQDKNIAAKAAENNWLTRDSLLNAPFYLTHNENLNIRTSIEPFPSLRIDVTANRLKTRNSQEYWKADGQGDFAGQNQVVNGNFSMSYNLIKTTFSKPDKEYNSKLFDNFKEYRLTIANRLANKREGIYKKGNIVADYQSVRNTSGSKYPLGYSATSQEALVPAFLAAYSAQNPEKVTLNRFPLIPLPNWMITFDGLTQYEFVKRYLKSVRINHSYRCDYRYGDFQSNSQFIADPRDNLGYVLDKIDTLYFIPEFDVNTVSLTEDFSPLLNIDMTWNNSLATKIEFRRSRTISLTFTNNQMMEQYRNEVIFGSGYRFNKVPLIINKKKYESDLNLRLDVSFKDDLTIIRKLVENVDQLTAGMKSTSIILNADYVLSEKFNIRFFYEHMIQNPRISTSYRTSNIKFGFSVRFTLIQ